MLGVFVSDVTLPSLEDRVQDGDQVLEVNGQSVGKPEDSFTVEPSNKGHYGTNDFVHCREVIPISEVK